MKQGVIKLLGRYRIGHADMLTVGAGRLVTMDAGWEPAKA